MNDIIEINVLLSEIDDLREQLDCANSKLNAVRRVNDELRCGMSAEIEMPVTCDVLVREVEHAVGLKLDRTYSANGLHMAATINALVAQRAATEFHRQCAADANAQLNALRGLVREYLAAAKELRALRAAAVESERDAARWRNHMAHEFPAFGCHCECDGADQCVIDTGNSNDCVYARKLVAAGKDKHSCEWWRPVNIKAMAAQNNAQQPAGGAA